MSTGKSEVAKREEEVLAFWKENHIFEKSLQKKSPKGEFIFYDGPPFATGLPHSGSLLSSVIKDVIPRYKTMRGYHVPRRWGWDTHGLPIESMVEKKLELKSKKDILNIGIDVFNETARSMVLRYVDDWEKYVDRVGRFVDFKNSYKTMDNSYIESVWWALKRLDSKKLLYEGRKVLMYCTHCETPLAKAEIAMDNTYKDITEETAYVKFKIKNPEKSGLPQNTSIVAWTTTPWTLPGNVALAVGKDISYVVVQEGVEHLLMAAERMPEGSKVVKALMGAELLGVEYEPLFAVPAIAGVKGKKYVVVAGDFVTTADGTGIVHIAPMYGEDDFALGQKEKLPMVQLLNANGTYNDLVPEALRGQYLKKGEKFIKEDLEKRGLLYKKEPHTHSYPHCYRCGTPLIYNAVGSWFINIQKVKAKMLSENEKITWVPEHLKHGRFKNNLENAPDWTISRNRFWASPLPIWKEKKGDKVMVVGSIDELTKKTKRSGNKYFVMRHGQAKSNVDQIFDSKGDPNNHLTEEGKAGVEAQVKTFAQKNKIDLIIMSPLVRTRETAKIAQKVLGVSDSAVMVDERLREIDVGIFNGKPVIEWRASFNSHGDPFTTVTDGAETYTQIRERVGDFIFEIERRYAGKNILIVTHERPAWLLNTIVERKTIAECIAGAGDVVFLRNGEIRPIDFVPFPHTKQYDLDLHRPYIDAITLVDEKGRQYERIPEVIDCWVESGAMPFASEHYPMKKDVVNPERFFGLRPKAYPADFIAEYIAQTRTWFYYMHAMGVLLFNKLSFRNVVTTGNILANDGSKMSKSKGNYTDPLLVMDMFGADAMRFYLMNSVVMQAEDFSFRDEEVREVHNRVVQMLWNCYKFFELYKAEYDGSTQAANSTHVLDRWVLSRLNQTTSSITAALDAYDTPGACRALRSFIDDYSTWYVRRSRDRVKGKDAEDKQYALATQRYVLLTLAQLSAPLMPFIAERLYKDVGGDAESVHLTSWPTAGNVDTLLIEQMETTRKLASLGLQARDKAGIKVRQPLASMAVKVLPTNLQVQEILKDELNVKALTQDASMEGEVLLDTTLTPELKEEGLLRDTIRAVQEFRKQANLSIGDRPQVSMQTNLEGEALVVKYKSEIMEETGLAALEVEVGDAAAAALVQGITLKG